tara:strand:+ start:1105 stop:2259 length:1155 start_codon:yes stop_codon:yes gene_type:complete
VTAESITLRVAESINEIDPHDWNRLTDPNDPFTDHAFLALLEESGSVGPRTGWIPVHLLAHRGTQLVGAMPLYLKDNSYGEYIFDWGWAQAAQRAGIPYYPKLVSAVPFTPATGRRLLALDSDVEQTLLDGLHGVAKATRALSIHILFCSEPESTAGKARPELIGRTTHQFHWNNTGYTSFDDWLSTFRSRRRKEVRRERAAPAKLGVEVEVIRGRDLTEQHWQSMRGFYERTIQKKHAQAYLTEEFFSLAPHRLSHSALLFFATHDGEPVAGSLCFQRGNHLMGRYWGCLPAYESLHFELCYHAPIELCIRHQWSHFEAGAQGLHKVQRGLAPARTHSLHHLRHPGLHEAVRDALAHEDAQVEAELKWCETKLPFHRTDRTTG